MQCERIRKLISRWHRDELRAARKAVRREMPENVSTDSRHYPEVRGARFVEGRGRFTGMPRIRIRYLTYKLRALCWVLRRLRAGRLSWVDAREPANCSRNRVADGREAMPTRGLINGSFSLFA
jgi:hypothetical protein